MSGLSFSFKFSTIGREEGMKKAGYNKRKHKGDWIRPDGPALRFHAKPQGESGIRLHVDVYTTHGHHVTHFMPETTRGEVLRIGEAIGAELAIEKSHPPKKMA